MNYQAKYVVCPFYKDYEKRHIKCEGEISPSCLQEFPNKTEADLHFRGYCCNNYRTCPFAMSLFKKYDFE